MTSITTDRVGGMVPEGVHPFNVVEFDERAGPSGDYWNFTCEIGAGSPFAGQRCWVVISLSAQSRWKAEQWLDCFEIPEGMEIDGEDFVGLSFRGKVIHEVGKDSKTRAKIDEFLPSQKVSLKKGAAPKVGVKKAAVVVEEDEDDDDDGDDDASTAEDDGVDYETDDDADDDDEDDEEEVKPAKKSSKPVKATKAPLPVAKKGNLPKPVSKYKRPF